ncbi:MAG: hypothetical protein HUJ67_00150 [Ruminiclostridium sp.]|nr:hypothetical protein [Ruminiclostridium sp.]
MNPKRRAFIGIGILFVVIACCFAVAGYIRFSDTGEGAVSSVLLTISMLCAAIAFFAKKDV